MFNLRPYKEEDKAALIYLLQANIPQFFAESEKQDFVQYLNEEVEDYFVVEMENQIVGAGGINYPNNKSAAYISWDFIHPDHQGKGIGKELTLFRVNVIKNKANVKQIVVRTSQMAYNFYQKMGFVLEKVEKDYWAKGYDLYHMHMQL
jgi:[ribosomal protein S18]-alanine N-acetyltransferase